MNREEQILQEYILYVQHKEKFVGVFINGKKNGNGILYDKNGNIIKSGVWESNEFVSDFKNWNK